MTYLDIGVSSETGKILQKRGVSPEHAKLTLFTDAPRKFLASSLATETRTALQLIEKSKKIGVFCDYDADGILSHEVIRTFLSGIDKKFTSYIPERSEKYGLNRSALRNLANRGVDTLITADCGSSDLEELYYAKSLGISTIVTDHHKYRERPPVDAFINPVGTEFLSLSGCSVAGMTLQSLSQQLFLESIPFMAVSAIGDLVPLHQESRFLVAEFLSFPKFPGILEAAFDSVEDFDTLEIAFNVVPKLNALSRMGTAKTALKLYQNTKSKSATILTNLNTARKNRQRVLTQEAFKTLNAEPPIIVVCLPEIDGAHGFYGLIASRVVEKYNKPALVGGIHSGRFKGSGRSIPGVNLYQVLEKASEFCDLEFGGHSVALGFSAKSKEKLEDGLEAITEYIQSLELTPVEQVIDMQVNMSDISRIITPFQELWPFGSGNPHLTIQLDDIVIPKATKNGFFYETRIGITKIMIHPDRYSKLVLKTERCSVFAKVVRADDSEISLVIE